MFFQVLFKKSEKNSRENSSFLIFWETADSKSVKNFAFQFGEKLSIIENHSIRFLFDLFSSIFGYEKGCLSHWKTKEEVFFHQKEAISPPFKKKEGSIYIFCFYK